jgi:nucleotide-binding universal stress UspA family protein
MLKRIAVHIEKSASCEARLSTAGLIAARFQAALVGIYPQYLPSEYRYDENVLPGGLREMLQQRAEEDRKRCEQMYRDRTAGASIAAEWRQPEGSPDEVLPLHARCADLLIIGQAGGRAADSDLAPFQAESIIMSAGRPVLMIPYSGQFPVVGERVLVCWDHGREAARALADAAPFLERAQEITVLTLDPDSDRMRGRRTVANDLQAYFQAHGYTEPRMVSAETADVGIGNAILNTASDYGSDLVVMGLYGHSRARELVLGGASREMLKTQVVPVLFSH